jgi:hypothetical protein
MNARSERIVDLYERHARTFDRERGRSLFERGWLDRFRTVAGAEAAILHVGCGSGEPIARYLIAAVADTIRSKRCSRYSVSSEVCPRA